MATVAPAPQAATDDKKWFALSGEDVASELGVDVQAGLAPDEAAKAAREVRPERVRRRRGRAALARVRAAVRATRCRSSCSSPAIGSSDPLKELGTGLVLLLLTLFNAVLGLRQEGKAAAAVAALQKMMIVTARVRRDGELAQIPAEQLVPGDVVSIEAGDVVPADGRLLRAATLEVAESALTGESLPVPRASSRHAAGHTAGRPDRHGLHEHERHPRRRGVRRHRHGHGDRGRPHLGHAAAQESDKDSPLTRQLAKLTRQILVDRRAGAGGLDVAQPGARRDVQRGLRRGGRVRDRRDPDRACPRWSPRSSPARRRSPRRARS